MEFKINSLYLTDGYKISHKQMLAEGTTKLYGTWIPRSTKHAPQGITKVVSFGQQLVIKWLHDEFKENFFSQSLEAVVDFQTDMCNYLGLEYNTNHFEDLWNLGYLPITIKSLPEGIETPVNIPHMTFINTVDGFGWLTLYLETIISSLAWKPSTSATIALQYKRNAIQWIKKTDPSNAWLVDYICHDFSARGLSPWDMITSGLGHATSFRGSDTLSVIPAARYFYNETDVCINSVNASEHSVTCTGIFYYQEKLKSGELNAEIKKYYEFDVPCEGSIKNPDYLAISEYLNLRDYLKKFPKGILSIVSDTFSLWKLITFILPRLKEEILAREGKLVCRPDSGDPVDIICGKNVLGENGTSEDKGVIGLLWGIFGGSINEQGYKVLDSHIGAIYGDSITLDRQIQIYEKLATKGFASTNIVLGIGSFTYQYNTRDTLGFAAKGSWFETWNNDKQLYESYNIYKDPITDDGTKKSLKGLCKVDQLVGAHGKSDYFVQTECTQKEEMEGLLNIIYSDGEFYNQTTFNQIRENINLLINK